MPKTIAKALLYRMLRSPGFRGQLEDLQHLSGTECLFLDDFGVECMRFPRSESLPLRRLMEWFPGLSHRHAAVRQAQLAGSDAPYQLPWEEQVHGVQVGGEMVGYVVLSAWRTEACTEQLSRSLWVEFAKEGAAVPWSMWQSEWLKLPEIHPRAYSAWQRLLRLQGKEVLRTLESETGVLPRISEHSPLIQDACHIVQECYADALTLQEVAAGCGVSAEHLSRQFHAITGLRFREYLAETRVQAVCQELRTTRDSISEIAGRNGFSTLSRFNRAFRSITGATPRDWRKRMGEV
ncbi:AraC family transcriptional regulator [Kiritimatiellaeota bacterium B1221]|nr:AraC family transcriptional regulator [Kiritimatiellaeota bacterium B1221]